jgi:hypothetical protein
MFNIYSGDRRQIDQKTLPLQALIADDKDK